jgi:hypothetical protein
MTRYGGEEIREIIDQAVAERSECLGIYAG